MRQSFDLIGNVMQYIERNREVRTPARGPGLYLISEYVASQTLEAAQNIVSVIRRRSNIYMVW